jgi:UV DNA damage endonuclease
VAALRPEEEVLRYLALENDERVWTVAEVAGVADVLGVAAICDNLHHRLNPGGISLREALDITLPTWKARAARPKLHLSSQDPSKRPGAHAYTVSPGDRHALLEALDGREADVMIEAKGKEEALAALGIPIG